MALACDISASLRDFEFVAPEAARPLYEASRSPCKVQQRGIFSLVFHTDPCDNKSHVAIPIKITRYANHAINDVLKVSKRWIRLTN